MNGFLDEGEVTGTDLDDAGEVVCKVVLGDGRELPAVVRLRQPPGFQGYPVDDSEGLDALFLRDGRLLEVVALVDRDVTQNLPKLKKQQTRIHSLEKNGAAQLLSILTNEILVGKNATLGGARLNDEVGGGTIVIAAASSGPPPTVTINITYNPAKGSPVNFGPLVVLGTYAGPPTVTFSILELIKTASDLVKVQ